MNTCSAITRRALLAAPLAAAPLPPAAAQRAPRPVALSTVAMVGDAVHAIAGDAVQAETLIGEGVDPHLFRPSRADVSRLLRADGVFLVGHRLEGRMGDVIARARASGRPVVAVAETLPRERLRAHPDFPDAADPHVWMDPVLWADAVASVAPALVRLAPGLDPAPGLAAFRARLARLDAYAREALAPIPAERRILVTAHDAFSYFGTRYGLRVESIQGLSTEAEASLAQIEALVALLVERRVPAVFAETSVPDRAVRALVEGAAARGHRVALGANLFSDSLGAPGTYRGTLEGMLDHNITAIARALGGEAPAAGLNGRL